MENKATFYYDETFHDRQLATKDGVLNAYLGTSNDSFIFAIIGAQNSVIDCFLEEYARLENETKDKLGLKKELKSTTFDNKNTKYGLASLRRECKVFYYDYFQLLIKHNILFQVGCISKTEIIMHRLLAYVKLPPFVIKPAFAYSFIKLIEVHRLDYLFTELLDNGKDNIKLFFMKTIKLLNTLLSEIEGIEREEMEVVAIKSVLFILSNSSYKNTGTITSNWNYDIVADAISKRIGETSYDCHVVIDEEQSTYEACQRFLIDSEQKNSKLSIGVRTADMFVGIVGRIIKSFKNDRKEPQLKNIDQIKRELYVRKRLLSKKWFEIDEETFILYKRIGSFFSSATYWSSFTLYYGDDIIMLFSLFNYINSYDSYSDYKNDQEMHCEHYNAYVCNQIANLFHEP